MKALAVSLPRPIDSCPGRPNEADRGACCRVQVRHLHIVCSTDNVTCEPITCVHNTDCNTSLYSCSSGYCRGLT